MQQNNNWSPVDDSSSSAAALATPELILYSFWQSSCSWRVRFALNLKGLLYEYRAVNLAKGEQFSPEFEKLNPLHYVPVLADGDILVSDSLAILLYLEEKYPQNALLPVDPCLRAINLQAANIVASSIQPLHMMTFLADVFLAPQIAIATRRFNIAMFNFPTLSKIFNSYMELPEFIASSPERQPDAIQ